MTQNIISIGQAAAMIQAMPDRIRTAAVALGIVPAMRINNVDHFAETDLERIAEHLRQGSPEVTAGPVDAST